MAKSGFVPAWMKIQSSDTLNHRQTSNKSETNSAASSPTVITGRQRHHSSEIFEHLTNTRLSAVRTIGQNRTKFHETSTSNDTDGFLAFSSSHSQARRSYSRERSSNGNGYRPSLNSPGNCQRRLHSVSSYHTDRPILNLQPTNEQTSDMTIKSNDNEQMHPQSPKPVGFDRLDQDFPSLNGRAKNHSSANDQSSSVWNNAASKFRVSSNDSFKFLGRSLSTNTNHSRPVGSTRVLTRKDRLLSTLNGNSSTSNGRTIALDLQTNCITQTRNLDKRSDFFNSLKNDSITDRIKPGDKHSYDLSTQNPKISNGILRLLSVPETAEEKELLVRMGWKESDDVTYEITDQDKEDYEKRVQLSPRNDSTSAKLMLALHRRALPYIDIVGDLLRWEQIPSTSDDESSDE